MGKTMTMWKRYRDEAENLDFLISKMRDNPLMFPETYHHTLMTTLHEALREKRQWINMVSKTKRSKQ